MSDQSKRPLCEALERYKEDRIVSFDVPGHKQGKGNKFLTDFFGADCVSIDVNSMKTLDNLCHPISVIKESMALAAEAFHAKNAFFMVNGTSSAVTAMIMATVKKGDKIILPRNVHRSALNALVITGAIPVYVDPGIHPDYGISLGMNNEMILKAITENRDAKAILVNNPTYYGVCSDLKFIVAEAHKVGMKVLVDEAHGTHFYFGFNMPISAMDAKADFAAVSIHKTGGSFTQSSLLLLGEDIDDNYVRQIINLTQTTSPSYLLMSSIDLARSNLALNGKSIFAHVVNFVDYAKKEINKIGGFFAFGKEMIDNEYVYDFDPTKLSIHTRAMGLAGVEVYDLLRDEYGIQIEFGDMGNILAIISVGDRITEIERLIAALTEIKRKHQKTSEGLFFKEYIKPKVVLSPLEAFYSDKTQFPLDRCVGKIAAEFVMCYPPGIPIVAPGEEITAEIIEYIKYAKEKGSLITGPLDEKIERISVVR